MSVRRLAPIRFAKGLWPGLSASGHRDRCMLAYYKKAGINATLALMLNSLILIAALAYFGAVLTLPGIAGVILTHRYGGRQ